MPTRAPPATRSPRPTRSTSWARPGRAGSYAEAIAHFQSALEIYRATGHAYEAPTLHHLARAHLAAGHPGRARETWRRALTRAVELGDPLAVQVRAELAALR